MVCFEDEKRLTIEWGVFLIEISTRALYVAVQRVEISKLLLFQHDRRGIRKKVVNSFF